MADSVVGSEKGLVDDFWSYLNAVMDEKGFFPLPGMSRRLDGTREVAAIMPVTSAYRYFHKLVADGQHSEVIVGVDRTTLPNQGTEFADVLTVAHWRRLPDGGEEMRIGVVNYRWKPRVLRPIDWSNSYWDGAFRRELNMVNGTTRYSAQEVRRGSDPGRDCGVPAGLAGRDVCGAVLG